MSQSMKSSVGHLYELTRMVAMGGERSLLLCRAINAFNALNRQVHLAVEGVYCKSVYVYIYRLAVYPRNVVSEKDRCVPRTVALQLNL